MKYFTLLVTLIFLTACSNPELEQELELLNIRLEKTSATLDSTRNELELFKNEESGQLTHIVFFKLKPDVDQSALIAEIKKLEMIKEVKDLEVGPFENLGDERALSEYSMVMEMSFEDADAYQVYQVHPIHLALRQAVKSYLAGPPATYDYMKK